MSSVNEFTTFHPQLHRGASSSSSSADATYTGDGADTSPLVRGFVRHLVQVQTFDTSSIAVAPARADKKSEPVAHTLTVDVSTENTRYVGTGNVTSGANARVSGLPILFVHGLASNKTVFAACAQRAIALGHAVAMVSLRGHSESYQSARCNAADYSGTGFTIHQLASDVLQVLRHLAELSIPGWSGPSVCIGHSYGGNVVVELASLKASRELLAGIVCVDGGYINLPLKYESLEACCRVLAPPNLSSFSHKSFVHMVRSEWMRGCQEDVVLSMLRNFVLRPDGSVASRVSVQTHMALLRDLYEHPPSFAEICVPVIFAPAGSGEANVFSCNVNEDVIRAMAVLEAAGIPTSVQWFRDSSHDIPSQQPELLMGFVHEAISKGFFNQ